MPSIFSIVVARIFIECAFGKLVMRCGIFWRKISFQRKESMAELFKQRCFCTILLCMNGIDIQAVRETIERNFFENFVYDEFGKE